MTVMSWYKKVQDSGKLTVASSATLKAGRWGTALDDAIKIFNKLMSDYGITLELTRVGDVKDALVVVDSARGKASFTFNGKTYPETLDGNGLHGATRPAAMQYGKKAPEIEKAFVFVPATPRIDPRNKKSREAGQEVRRYILVHEFIHAAGLSDSEHTNDDVFCYPGEIVTGPHPPDDRVQPWGGLGQPAPPYTLVSKTISNIKKAWP